MQKCGSTQAHSAFDSAAVCKALWSARFSHFATGNETFFPDLVWHFVTNLSSLSRNHGATLELPIGFNIPRAAAPGFLCIENKSQTVS